MKGPFPPCRSTEDQPEIVLLVTPISIFFAEGTCVCSGITRQFDSVAQARVLPPAVQPLAYQPRREKVYPPSKQSPLVKSFLFSFRPHSSPGPRTPASPSHSKEKNSPELGKSRESWDFKGKYLTSFPAKSLFLSWTGILSKILPF